MPSPKPHPGFAPVGIILSLPYFTMHTYIDNFTLRTDTVGSVPDTPPPGNKANIAVNQVTAIFSFPSAYRSVYTLL